jgi:hypothetical protein
MAVRRIARLRRSFTTGLRMETPKIFLYLQELMLESEKNRFKNLVCARALCDRFATTNPTPTANKLRPRRI